MTTFSNKAEKSPSSDLSGEKGNSALPPNSERFDKLAKDDEHLIRDTDLIANKA